MLPRSNPMSERPALRWLRPKKQASNELRQTKDGFIFLDLAKFADVGADLPKATAEFMARSQMPILGAAFSTKLTVAAWHDKPSYVIIATEDRELDPAIARMAKPRGVEGDRPQGEPLHTHLQPPCRRPRDRDSRRARQNKRAG